MKSIGLDKGVDGDAAVREPRKSKMKKRNNTMEGRKSKPTMRIHVYDDHNGYDGYDDLCFFPDAR